MDDLVEMADYLISLTKCERNNATITTAIDELAFVFVVNRWERFKLGLLIAWRGIRQ